MQKSSFQDAKKVMNRRCKTCHEPVISQVPIMNDDDIMTHASATLNA